VKRDGNHRWNRPTAEDKYQNQCDDNFRQRTHRVHQATKNRDHPWPRGQTMRRKQSQNDGKRDPDEGRNRGDIDCFDQDRKEPQKMPWKLRNLRRGIGKNV